MSKKARTVLATIIAAALLVSAVLIVSNRKRQADGQQPQLAAEEDNTGETDAKEASFGEYSLTKELLLLAHQGEEGYPPYDRCEYNVGKLTQDLYCMTASGKVVKDIMSYSVMTSNPRYIKFTSESNLSAKNISGPNLILNGYKVLEGDFYCANEQVPSKKYMGELDDYVGYVITSQALRKAGLKPIEPGKRACAADRILDYEDNVRASCGMSELEQDITFTLLDYDEDTNTYIMSAVNNGPYGGTSDIFYNFYESKPVKVFPTLFFASPYGSAVVPKECVVDHDDFNHYWVNHGVNRNEIREQINKAYGTQYPPLDYERDVEIREKDYWSIVNPEMYARREEYLASIEQAFKEHPEKLEEWKEFHPGWETIDYMLDAPPVTMATYD